MDLKEKCENCIEDAISDYNRYILKKDGMMYPLGPVQQFSMEKEIYMRYIRLKYHGNIYYKLILLSDVDCKSESCIKKEVINWLRAFKRSADEGRAKMEEKKNERCI